jgi:hypothetical protein
MQKHPREGNDVTSWICELVPAIREGEGEGDDPNLKMQLDIINQQAQAPRKGNKWTSDEIETTGRHWHADIMKQWHQGVQEKQISRTEAINIRKEGSFPIYIKEMILPMWDAWKGASFEAIQGLCEMSIQMQRTKMKSLRNIDRELYRPQKKLDGKQLESRMKTSKEARRTHQILKWTGLINDALIWRSSELAAREIEKSYNDGEDPREIFSHIAVREKKKASLAKYMKNLASLIAPYDPDDDEIPIGEGQEDDDLVHTDGLPSRSPEERVQRVVDGFFTVPAKPVPKTVEQKRREESEKRSRREECELQTLLNSETTSDMLNDILEANWEDPRVERSLHKTCLALRAACMNHTLGCSNKEQDKFIQVADQLRNRNEWVLDKKHTYRK